MRLASVAALIAVALLVAGCDAIYERPELNATVDFGEPYLTRNAGGTTSPGGTLDAPYVTSDERLVVDVSYGADCEASRFVLRVEVRDQETIDFWLVHSAAENTCDAGVPVSRRLVYDLPANAVQFRRQILLTPDRGSIVLERELG